MKIKVGLIAVCLMLLLILQGSTGYASPIGKQLVLEDTGHEYKPSAYLDILADETGRLRIEEIMQPDMADRFKPNEQDVPNYGYTASVHWVRLQVVNASSAKSWLMELEYPPLDHVDLYLTEAGKGIIHKWSGDGIPFSDRDVLNRNITFELDLNTDPNKEVTIYLRVDTEGAMALPIKIVHPVQFAVTGQLTYMLLGCYYGLMLIMVIYNSTLAFSFRSRVFFNYVLLNVSNLFLYCSLNGIAFEYIWPDAVWWNNRAIVFFMCLSHLSALLFTSEFLSVKRRYPRFHRLFRAFGLLEVLNILVLLVSYPAGLYMTIYSVPLIEISLIVAGVLGLVHGFRPARYFMLGWGVFMIGAILSTMSDAGYLPMEWWTTYASQIGSTCEAVVLSWGLAYQIQSMRMEKEQAVAQMKETRRLADIDDLTGLYNRRYVIRAFEEAASTADDHPISLIMLDLDHFKKVNDTFGHDVGDLVLQKLAEVMEGSFRPSDVIGRFGGEEFMVLLKNTNSEQARSAAEYVLRSVREHRFVIREQTLHSTISLGIAQWDPLAEEDFKSLLRRADQALYEAKRAGRNRVSVADTRRSLSLMET